MARGGPVGGRWRLHYDLDSPDVDTRRLQDGRGTRSDRHLGDSDGGGCGALRAREGPLRTGRFLRRIGSGGERGGCIAVGGVRARLPRSLLNRTCGARLLAVQALIDRDRPRRRGRVIITGSVNLLLMKAVADSLAGGAAYRTLHALCRLFRAEERWRRRLAAGRGLDPHSARRGRLLLGWRRTRRGFGVFCEAWIRLLGVVAGRRQARLAPSG